MTDQTVASLGRAPHAPFCCMNVGWGLACDCWKLAAGPDPDAPAVDVELDLGPEPNPPQAVRLPVTGCAGADRLVVVVDLGMGSPNRHDTGEQAIVAAGQRCLALRSPEDQDRSAP